MSATIRSRTSGSPDANDTAPHAVWATKTPMRMPSRSSSAPMRSCTATSRRGRLLSSSDRNPSFVHEPELVDEVLARVVAEHAEVGGVVEPEAPPGGTLGPAGRGAPGRARGASGTGRGQPPPRRRRPRSRETIVGSSVAPLRFPEPPVAENAGARLQSGRLTSLHAVFRNRHAVENAEPILYFEPPPRRTCRRRSGPRARRPTIPWRSRVEAGRRKRDAAVPDGDEQPHCPAGWCRGGKAQAGCRRSGRPNPALTVLPHGWRRLTGAASLPVGSALAPSAGAHALYMA